MKPTAKKAATKTATKTAPKKAAPNKAAFKKGDTVCFTGWDGPAPDYEEGDTEIEVGMVGTVRSVSSDEIEVAFELDGDTNLVELGLKELRIATKKDIEAAAALADDDGEEEEEEETEEEEEEEEAEQSIGSLADEGDKKAIREMNKAAKSAGLDPDDYSTYVELEEALAEDTEEEEEEDEEEEEEEEDAVVVDETPKGKAKSNAKAAAAAAPAKEKSLGRLADEGDKKAIKELTARANKVSLDPEDAENGETWTQFERTLKTAEKEAARPKLIVSKSVSSEIEEDGDNAIAAAKRLLESAERTYYTLGGVLAVISRQKLHEQVKVKGEYPYAVNKGFETFCEEHLNVRYRKAQYLINIYEAFTNAGLTEAKIGSIGWSKAKELVAVLEAEPEQADKWLETAKSSSTAEVADAVKARLTKIGAKSHGNAKTTRSVSCKFTVHADQGKVVEEAIALAMEQIDSEDQSAAFAHIVSEWLTYQK